MPQDAIDVEALGTWRENAPPPGTCLSRGDGKEVSRLNEEVKLAGMEEMVGRPAVSAV